MDRLSESQRVKLLAPYRSPRCYMGQIVECAVRRPVKISSWAKDTKIGASLINADAETVAEKAELQDAIIQAFDEHSSAIRHHKKT